MPRQLLILLISLLTFQATADPKKTPPRFLSVVIPGMINADGSGTYLQLLNETLGITGNEIMVLPTNRALREFSNASAATCLIPMDRKSAGHLGLDTRNKIFSKPFNTSFATIISQRGKEPAQSLYEIEGRIVGVLLGFPVAEEVVAAAASVVRPNSMEALLKMLEFGRIDFAYVHLPDVLMSYDQKEISPFPESNIKFQEVEEAVACTRDARDWIDRFNEAIDLMYQNGSITSTLGASFTGR